MTRVVVKARNRGAPAPKSAVIALYPMALEESYTRALEARMKALVSKMQRAIGPYDVKRRDADEDDLTALVAIAEQVGFDHETRYLVKGPREIRLAGTRVRKWQDRHTSEMVGRILGIGTGDVLAQVEGKPLGLALERWMARNLVLIQAAEDKFREDVARIISQGVERGITTREMAKQIEARGNVARSRARLIARDQTGSLNAQIAQTRQQQIGITQYRWQTSLDSRVRHSHRERQGKVFSWDDPPPDGHPGEPINCRCVAKAVIPPDLDIFS